MPIPEREPTDGDVPTYAELGVPERLSFDVSEDLHDRAVHVDPEFAGSLGRDRYTYGDEHGVKAGPLSTLEPDERSADTSQSDGDPASAVESDGRQQDCRDERPPSWATTNAHVQRETVDAEVLLRGSESSQLFERAVPLSEPTGGADGTLS